MKEKFRLICIPIIVLTVLSFVLSLVAGILTGWPLIISGTVLILLSLIFTIIAMIKNPFISIGTIVLECIAQTFFYSFNNLYLHATYLFMTLIFAIIFANISIALSIIYVGFGIKQKDIKTNDTSKQLAPTVSTTNNTPNLSKLMDFSQELQQFKYLLDNGILTEEEFAEQKAKIMKKYGLATANKNVAISIVGTPQIAIDGDYDMGALVLTLLGRSFAFKSKETQTVAMRGTFIFDKNTRSLTLFKTDNTMIKMSVNQDGNLVSPNGTVYTKIH